MARVTVEELIARESIRDLVARYNLYGDRGDLTRLGELFVDEGVLEFDMGGGARSATGGAAIARMLADVAAGWAGQASVANLPRYVRHIVSTHVIDFESTTEALGRAYVLVVRAQGLESTGRYLDRYVEVGDGWKFRHRRALRDPR